MYTTYITTKHSHTSCKALMHHVMSLIMFSFPGLVDIETGKVTQGIELLPLKEKVFSGWYSRVAVRQLKNITDKKREEMTKHLLDFKKELGERPYEKKKLELIRSALDFHEDFLTFLKNEEEDLSSLFCSELVAAAYQRMGLLEFGHRG